MTDERRTADGGDLGLGGTVVVPVAEPDDARASAQAVSKYIDADADVLVVHVVEKAGGAPDKASVEQREAVANEAFDAFRDALDAAATVDTDIRYDTDVADAVFDAAGAANATAIAFTPRSGSRWIRLLTGDVALNLVTRTDRPVVVLPDVEAED